MSVRLERVALAFAEHGYHVFPCTPRDKLPRIPAGEGGRGFKDANTDEGAILRWWDRWPTANVGVACGASKLVALDIDSKSGADPREVIDGLELHDYPTILTGEAPDRCERYPNSLSGVRGAQVWFGGELPTVKEATLPGVEIRGTGSYVMAPGSIHPSGVPYELPSRQRLPPAANLPAIPDRVTAIAVIEPAAKNGRTPPEVWTNMLNGINEGSRHRSLLRLIGHLLRRYIDPDLTAGLAHAVNRQCCLPPLPAGDVDKLVEDVCSAELRRRTETSAS
jgi:Bifunctional DNA primase/polymerase, N-terminal/Primase C terminal 1 (PriCT-1)